MRFLHDRPAMPFSEFVCLMAVMISIVALSIDSMLPALSYIGEDLKVKNPNNVQYILSALIFGLMIGQLFVGVLSDRFGRRPLVHLGFIVFIFGSLISSFAKDFEIMLLGRVLQGLGAAAPKIITVAIVRDKYTGREMARTMSIIMAVFILLPAIAPSIGQTILFIGNWRSIFIALLLFSLFAWLWFALRQAETLTEEKRRPLSLKKLRSGVKRFFSSRIAFGYTVCTGILFGVFLGYLNLSQKIFQETYQTGAYFSLWFGCSALSIGVASIINSRLVIRLGMTKLIKLSLSTLLISSTIFLLVTVFMDGTPPFWFLMSWLIFSFPCFGLLFSNLNALAMEPLGKIAGLGAALVGSISSLISLPLGWLIASGYDGGVSSLAVGFTAGAATTFIIIYLAQD